MARDAKRCVLTTCLMLAGLASPGHASAQAGKFPIEETTIADVHAAIQRRELTCVQLIQQYLNRIERYNKTLRALIHISFTQDRVGAYARTVKDAAILLQAIAGYDPNDPVTAASRGRMPRESYAGFPAAPGLAGARLGVVRQFMTAWTPADKESVDIAQSAIDDMKKAGTEIIDVSADIDKALALLLPQLNPAYLSSPAPYLDRGYLPKLDPEYADPAKFPGNYFGSHADAPFTTE